MERGWGVLIRAAAALLVLVGAAACEGWKPEPGEGRRLPKATGTCIPVQSINSWSKIDDRRLVVWTRPPRTLEFIMPCHGLHSTQQLRFETRDIGPLQRICDYRNDAVIVGGDPVFGRGGFSERCVIAAITPYESEEDRQLGEEIDEQIEEELEELDEELEREIEEEIEEEAPEETEP